MRDNIFVQLSQPLILSFETLCVSMILFVSLGVPLAFLLAKEKLPLRWLLDIIVTLPLIFPPIAVGFFLLLMLGREGWFGAWLYRFDISIIFSFTGIVIAAFVAGLPLMVKPLQSAIQSFPQTIKEASY